MSMNRMLLFSFFSESGMLPRQKRRAGGGGQAANKVINAIYHKLTEVVDTLAVLTETQPLTDTIVLLVCMYVCMFGD